MKVLFIVGELKNEFGMSPFIYSQGESLKKSGVDVKYLILKGRSFIKYITGIAKIKKKTNNEEIDIIHAHYSYCGWSALFQKKIPVIVSLMGSDVLENPNIIKKIINNCILNSITSDAASIICKTDEIRKKIKRKNSVFTIPNGVNLDLFKPLNKTECRNKLNLNSVKKYILFASNPKNKWKNYNLAIKAVNKLDDINIELKTVFNKKKEELLLYYNACDILILTSDYEGSNNVIKEAMACNLPIVSVDVGDVRKNLIDVNGCYIVERNEKKIADKIKLILNNREKTDGRNKIKDELDENIIAMQIKKVYEFVLQGNTKY